MRCVDQNLELYSAQEYFNSGSSGSERSLVQIEKKNKIKNPSTFIGRASREGLEQIYTVSFNLCNTAAAAVCVLAAKGKRQTTQHVRTMQNLSLP